MITKLEGHVNGQALIFERIAGGIWAADIPGKLVGIYIVDMTAYDDAGNVAYISKYLLAYDPQNLCVHLTPYIYDAELPEDDYNAQLTDDAYTQSIDDLYAQEIAPDDYYADTVTLSCDQM